MNERWLKLVEQTDQKLAKLEQASINRIEKALDGAYNKLERSILAKYPQYTADAKPGLLATQRSLLLLNEIKSLMPLVSQIRGAELQAEYRDLLKQASAEGVSLSAELMQAMAGKSFVKSTAHIPVDAVTVAAQQSYKRLEKHGIEFADKASVIVTQGLIQGMGVKKIVPGLRQQLGITKGRAEAIARTETMAAHNQAAQQTYERNGVSLIQVIATADSRTCRVCAARNGSVYKAGSVQVPWHVRCRCYAMPWIEGMDNSFVENFQQQILRQFEATGQQLDFGVSPFEKAAGVEKPPTPIWSPGQAQAPKPEPTGKKTQKPKPATDPNAKEPTMSKVAMPFIAKGFQYSQPFLDGVLKLDFRTKEGKSAGINAMQALRSDLLKRGSTGEEIVAQIAKNKIQIESSDPAIKAAIIEFGMLTKGKVLRQLKRVFKDKDRDRAYASIYSGALNIGTAKTPLKYKMTMFHELGHFLEYTSPKLAEASKDWILSRSTSTKPQPLNSLIPGSAYRDEEIAYPDKFVSPYVGKVYAGNVTEVVSMGMEAFVNAEYMLNFYRMDPAHFMLILGGLIS